MDRGRFEMFGNEPVCKFGPGGDYIRQWPGKVVDNADLATAAQNPLRKVLASLADIIGTTLDIASLAGMGVEGPGPVVDCRTIHETRQENHVAADNESRTGYAKTTGDVKAHPAVRAEPLLFADDSGAGTGDCKKKGCSQNQGAGHAL